MKHWVLSFSNFRKRTVVNGKEKETFVPYEQQTELILRSSKKSLNTLIEQGLAMASNNPEITYANIMRVDYHNFDGLTETFSETEYDVIHKDGKAVLANKQKRQH